MDGAVHEATAARIQAHRDFRKNIIAIRSVSNEAEPIARQVQEEMETVGCASLGTWADAKCEG